MSNLIVDKKGFLRVPKNKYADNNEVIPFKGRTIDYSKPIRIYRNLTKKGVWYSIVQKGKTVAHSTAICVKDAVFHVNEKTRQRVIKNKRKEFHAYIEGFYTTSGMGTTAAKNDLCVEIKYNPYKYKQFTCTNLTRQPFEIKSALFVIANKEGVKASYITKY